MVRWVGAAVVGGVLYFTLAWISYFWAGDLKPSTLWLATASVSTVALYVGTPLAWSVIAGGTVGGLISGPVLFDDTLPGMLGPVLGNALETVLVVLAVPAVVGVGLAIRKLSHGVYVLLIVVGAAGAGGLVAIAGDESVIIGETGLSWARWTLGNSVGEMLLLPLVLFRHTAVINRPPRGEFPTEIVVTFAALIVSAVLSFIVDWPMIYLIVPAILWLAIRFGPVVAAPLAVVIACAIAVASGQGEGPFVEYGSNPRVQIQLFIVTISTCVILGGAHAVRAWNDRQRLVAVLSAMPDILFIRDRGNRELLGSWVPEGSEDRAELLEPNTGDVPTPLADELVDAGEPTIVFSDSTAVFERRTVPIDDDRELELLRDISIEQDALRELQLRREAVDDARMAERRRIGTALHDSPVQLLAASLIRLNSARRGGPSADEAIEKAESLTRQAMNELRDKLDELIPPDIGQGEVVPALGHLARQLLDSDVEVVLTDRVTSPPPPDVCETLYLVGREAVSNVALHAEARRVEIELGEDEGGYVVTVTDDGAGIPAAAVRSRGFGLGLMRERINERGGTLRIAPDRAGGTTVTASVPHR